MNCNKYRRNNLFINHFKTYSVTYLNEKAINKSKFLKLFLILIEFIKIKIKKYYLFVFFRCRCFCLFDYIQLLK